MVARIQFLCVEFDFYIYLSLRACEELNRKRLMYRFLLYDSDRNLYLMRPRRGSSSSPPICPNLVEKRVACASSMVEYWGHAITNLLWLATGEM